MRTVFAVGAMTLAFLFATAAVAGTADSYVAACQAAQSAKVTVFDRVGCSCFGRMLDPVEEVSYGDRLWKLFNEGKWVQDNHVNSDIGPAIDVYLFRLLQSRDVDKAGDGLVKAGYAIDDTQRAESTVVQALKTCRN